MAVFSSNESLNLVIESHNIALNEFKLIFTTFFSVALVKWKSVIFTRRKYLNHPNVYSDNHNIPFVSNITYIDITLDSRLRWLPYIMSLTSFGSSWVNCLRAITDTW